MNVSKWLEKPETLKAELAKLRRRIETLLQKWQIKMGGSDDGRVTALLSEVDSLMWLLDSAGEDVPLSEERISKFRELYLKTNEFEGQCKEGVTL
ncbi:MAG: hypothetical protein PHG89_00570 [Gallionella sp.]|nr:hypothetical protein [Gallionella sp.]